MWSSANLAPPHIIASSVARIRYRQSLSCVRLWLKPSIGKSIKPVPSLRPGGQSGNCRLASAVRDLIGYQPQSSLTALSEQQTVPQDRGVVPPVKRTDSSGHSAAPPAKRAQSRTPSPPRSVPAAARSSALRVKPKLELKAKAKALEKAEAEEVLPAVTAEEGPTPCAALAPTPSVRVARAGSLACVSYLVAVACASHSHYAVLSGRWPSSDRSSVASSGILERCRAPGSGVP